MADDQMADDPYGLRGMSNEELSEWTASRKPATNKHSAGLQEMARRKDFRVNLRTWAALAVSLLSLAVAIVAFSR